ncbi:MAG: leucine-rich repeat domain-containing protein [Chitinispirillaceae bacterium]|nr:leucine-rich repeat domain-containing protein [Chitinispirillaceae bacterium]
MSKPIPITILLSIDIFAQGITLSQDSLKIYNNRLSSFAGTIAITNGSQDVVQADSIHLVIQEIDTAEWAGHIIGEGLEVSWRDYINQSRSFFWNTELIAEDTFRLVLRASAPEGAVPLVLNARDSCVMFMLQIGRCLGCSGLPTGLPAFFTGRLILFFSNGEEKVISLYSEDLRSTDTSDASCTDYACDSSVIRQILDMNGLDTVAVQSVSSVNNGRVVQLHLVYDQSLLRSLPKRLAILPASVGRLSALQNLDVSGNTLDSVPESIGRCTDLEFLCMYRNRLSVFPGWITGCTGLKRLGLGENQLDHIPESIGMLRALKDLLLGENRLTRLPDSIGALRSLKVLDISGNLLETLPASVVYLDSLSCLFLAGNSICSLSARQEEWVRRVPTGTNCTRWEPEWPDSQQCDAAFTRNSAFTRRGLKFKLWTVVRTGDFNLAEITSGDDAIRNIEIFDSKGRRVEIERTLSYRYNYQAIRLKMRAFSAGIYHVRIIFSTSDAVCRTFVVD